MPRKTISFIVPVRNDAARLRVALDSIRRVAYPQELVEIIVADNGSTDGSAEVAHSRQARVLDLAGKRVSEMRNIAARMAHGDVLAFVDADNEIAAGWTHAAMQILREEGVAAVGQPYHAPLDGNWVQQTYDALRACAAGREDVEWLGSGNLAIRRDVFFEVGGFDARLVTCEDVDLCYRIRQRGYRIVRDSRLASVHHGDPDTLGRVFAGELWRGQDNLRVSLRRPLAWRPAASLALSMFLLAALALLVASPLLPAAGLLFATGLAGAVAIVALRAVRMVAAQRARHRVGPLVVCRSALVAAAYELGRALALVLRRPHRRAHAPSSAAAHV